MSSHPEIFDWFPKGTVFDLTHLYFAISAVAMHTYLKVYAWFDKDEGRQQDLRT